MTPIVVLGPRTGSSRAEISLDHHGRLILRVETDFGMANGVFTVDQARQIRDAINHVLGSRV